MTRLSGTQVAKLAYDAGFRGSSLPIAVAVAKAESGWDTTNRLVTSQEDSRGLWQINTYAHHNFDRNRLYDGAYNAYAARVVYNNAGGRWTPWTTYTRGTYQHYMGEAQTAVRGLQSVGYNPGSVIQGIVEVGVQQGIQVYVPNE